MITCRNEENKPCFVMGTYKDIYNLIKEKITGQQVDTVDNQNYNTILAETGWAEFESQLDEQYKQYNKVGEDKIKYSRNQQRLDELNTIEMFMGTFSLLLFHQYSHRDPLATDGNGLSIGQFANGLYPVTKTNPTYRNKRKIIDKISVALGPIKNFYFDMLEYKFNRKESESAMKIDFTLRNVEEQEHFKDGNVKNKGKKSGKNGKSKNK